MNANAYKGRGVDPETTEAKTGIKQQAFQDRAAGSDNAVQRALRDSDLHERKLPELRKAEGVDYVVREMALA
jgi:hypothetical protein